MEARKVLIFDNATMANATYDLGNYSRWGKVGITLEWDSFDKTDAVVSFKIKNNAAQTTWETIPLLQYTIGAAAGTETLEHREFANARVAVDIDKGSNTTGELTIWIFQKD